jgi:putative thioredoxin
VPVIVDFWAEWCGPCRTLTPALEAAIDRRSGSVELAKVDVDANQMLAQAFGIRGIPAVKAFRDGQVVSDFTGAVPPPEVERFFDSLVPSEAEELAAAGAAAGDEAALRRALELDRGNVEARRALGRILLQRGDTEEAVEVLEGAEGDFAAVGLATRGRLELEGEDELAPAFASWDAGDYAGALERLQEALAGSSDPARRDAIRRLMVAIFTELGHDHPLAREHRRRLSAVLN